MNRLIHAITGLALFLCAGSAQAVPLPYSLDGEESVVGFTYYLDGNPFRGTMPVAAARITIDLARLANSRVDVALDARRARAGIFLATQAMRGARVLDTDNHPFIRFRTTRFEGGLEGATVQGELTVKGVTRPVTLTASLYRQRGTEPGDTSHLSVLLTGRLSRSAFGATGYPGLVGDEIEIRIIVRMDREN